MKLREIDFKQFNKICVEEVVEYSYYTPEALKMLYNYYKKQDLTVDEAIDEIDLIVEYPSIKECLRCNSDGPVAAPQTMKEAADIWLETSQGHILIIE